jgi:hypothetical protein
MQLNKSALKYEHKSTTELQLRIAAESGSLANGAFNVDRADQLGHLSLARQH